MRKIEFWLVILLFSIFVLLAALYIPGFSDFYIRYIFPMWVDSYGRGVGAVRFSVGEILLYLTAFYAVFTVLLWIIRFILLIFRKESLKRLTRFNSKLFPKIVIIIIMIMVLNCYVLYHSSALLKGTSYDSYEPTYEDLYNLRENLIKRANELSADFERDKNGYIIYEDDFASLSKIAMQGLGEKAALRLKDGTEKELDNKLSLLAGYYPAPKPLISSWFFSQQYMKGYYFPFSLEANYNDLMYVVNKPATMCHELAHLKGFIQEDEASFLSFLCCVNSNDEFFEYSGILDVLPYVERSLKQSMVGKTEDRESLTAIDELVIKDMTFLTEEAWEAVEKISLFDTNKVNELSDKFVNTYLTANGVEEGKLIYSGVVELLLKYYYGGEFEW